MRFIWAIVLAALAWAISPSVSELASQSGSQASDPDVLREANRILEEEIKLAAHPQIYLLLDLSDRSITIKGRGVKLSRLPIVAWQAVEERAMAGVFRLRARPQVVRPKAAPQDDPAQDPIELKDMPAAYELLFDPTLTVTVVPPLQERPWLWVKSLMRDFWTGIASWIRSTDAKGQKATSPFLRLTLSVEAAQSLAWSVTDGMPLLIRRVTSQ
ncbi:MAG TPA: hypothetical protein VJM82_03530 [Nitrospiraceae bacterium]|nr:hypothetical protein [Nitrospiraceae bacterium]